MPTVRLSPAFVRRVTCPSGHKKIDYFDTAMRGFMLEVRASGGKTYYQRYADEAAKSGSSRLVRPTYSPYGRPSAKQRRSRLWQFSAVIRKGSVRSEDQFQHCASLLKSVTCRSCEPTNVAGKRTRLSCVFTYYRTLVIFSWTR